MNYSKCIPKTTIFFYGASIALSVTLLIVGIPRLVITGRIKFGSGGMLIGGAVFPFPWYLLVPTAAIVFGTIVSSFRTTVRSASTKMKKALAIMGVVLLTSISYFVYVADYWYMYPVSSYGLPTGNGTHAIIFTTPYTAYPPPAGYSQYLYYAIVGLFLLMSVLLTVSLILKNRTDTG